MPDKKMRPKQIGILYSTESGVALRTINPDDDWGNDHLDWLEKNVPEGCTLLRIDKSEVGADQNHCPNLDTLIPHVRLRHKVDLQFGIPCHVVDDSGEIIDTAQACPILYQKKLDKDHAEGKTRGSKPHKVIHHCSGNVGDKYDEAKGEFICRVYEANKKAKETKQ